MHESSSGATVRHSRVNRTGPAVERIITEHQHQLMLYTEAGLGYSSSVSRLADSSNHSLIQLQPLKQNKKRSLAIIVVHGSWDGTFQGALME